MSSADNQSSSAKKGSGQKHYAAYTPDYGSMNDDASIRFMAMEEQRKQAALLHQMTGGENFDHQAGLGQATQGPVGNLDNYFEDLEAEYARIDREDDARFKTRLFKVNAWMMILFLAFWLGMVFAADYHVLKVVFSKHTSSDVVKPNVVGRQAYSYGGEHPTITITGFPTVTSHLDTSVTDHLTVTATTSVTVPVTVSTDVAETTFTGLNNITVTETSTGVASGSTQTQVFNTTASEIETVTVGSNVTITEVATSTSEGNATVTPFVPGPHSWPNSTVSITHWVPVTDTSASYSVGNGTSTSDIDTTVPVTTTMNVTVTLSPIPLWTTGGTGAATGTVSNTTTTFIGHSTHSTVPSSTISVSNSSSQVASTTTTGHGTIYTTVTETISPSSDNCTLSASETVFSTAGSDAVTASHSTTSSSTASMETVVVTIPVSSTISDTAMETITSTSTETVTPVYTVEMTKSVTETIDNSISVYTVTTVNVNTITVTLSRSSTATSTSSTEPCGEHETDTVTTTVVSTVWGVPTSTSTSSVSTSLSVPVSTETVSIGYSTTVTYTDIVGISTSHTSCNETTDVVTVYPTANATTTGHETTITSTATLNGTLTRTTGGVDGITASHSYANSSIVTIPCNSTEMYTITVLPAASNPAVTTTASSDGPGVIISTIITTITTGSLHPHSVSDISTSTALFHPMSVNSTGLLPPMTNGTDMGNMTSMGNMTADGGNSTDNYRPSSLPVGPAGINSTEPMVMNGTTMTMPMEPTATQTHAASTTTVSSLARRQGWDDEHGAFHCVVMIASLLSLVHIW